jgi:DNA-3-methyladenine glycosylase
MNFRIISRSFYERLTTQVAYDLVGCCIVRIIDDQILMGEIIETEAYQGSDDPASHAFCGKTERNKPMFGACGISYVYFTYGMHFCLNIIAKDRSQGAGAILIRAIKPLEGIDFMKKMRGDFVKEKFLTNGPAKLTQALCIDKKLNAIDITNRGNLFCVYGQAKKRTIIETSRVGIRAGKEFLWRFSVNDED